MGFKDASGRIDIDTGVDMYECSLLTPRTEEERRQVKERGPLYRIIASLSRSEEAELQAERLYKQYNDKVRIEILTAKRDIEALSTGKFKVKIDGVEVTEEFKVK